MKKQVEKKSLDCLTDSDTLGVCVKSPETNIVLYQNEKSVDICGEKSGDACTLCQDNSNQSLFESVASPDIKKNLKTIDHKVYDAVQISQSNTIVTILNSLEDKQKDMDVLLESLNLTEREKDIARMLVFQKTNAEISSALFISESTLRTHLNNVYKKAPVLKQLRTQH